jgi:hypothetical protein
MDGERYREAVNDPLDRELESLLDVEPSPEFLARVRTRAAAEREPGRGHAPWMFAAAGAVGVVIVTVLARPSPEVTSSNQAAVEPPRIAAGAPSMALPQPAPLPQSGRSTAVRAVAATFERDRGIDIDLPEVVLGDNEVKAYAALVANIRRSRFDAAVPAAPNQNTPLEIKALPPVEPLEIEPIVRVAALQAEGERP